LPRQDTTGMDEPARVPAFTKKKRRRWNEKKEFRVE
jgi:hypothetical protein